MKITQSKLSKLIVAMADRFLVEHDSVQKSEALEILLELQNRINKKDSRGDHEGQSDNFVSLFELIAFCSRCEDINLHQEIIWKYPGVCSYCVKPVCDCSNMLFRPDKATDKAMDLFRMRAVKFSSRAWVGRDHLLYPCHSNDSKNLSKLWRHFLSEGCELSSAYLRKQRGVAHNLGEELADLFEKAVNLCCPLKIPILDLWDARYT